MDGGGEKPVKKRRKGHSLGAPPACRAALSSCMKGGKRSGKAKTCMVDFNRCRKP